MFFQFIQNFIRGETTVYVEEEKNRICQHDNPQNVLITDIQAMDDHIRYVCNYCHEIVTKHVDKDKEFNEKYKKLAKKKVIQKVTMEYESGEKQYLEGEDAKSWLTQINNTIAEMMLARNRRYNWPEWKNY